jgi:NADH-quinone oxidoreductase subunit H
MTTFLSLLSLIPPPLLQMTLALVVIIAFLVLNGLIAMYMERKVAGFIQRRVGPYEVGPQGILQPFADAVKLLGKQLMMPVGADRILFWASPLISFAPVVICFLPMPVSPKLVGMDLNLGLLLILAFSGLNVLALCLAGWASNNKFSLLGAARAVSQSVAYEIPLLLAVLSIAFQTGSLNLTQITLSQTEGIFSWHIFTQPLAFMIFLIAMTAETNRAPFDLPEAESELTAGFHTEYSGMCFALYFLAEYSYMILVCVVASVLFFGGWDGPFLSGPLWLIIKAYALLMVLMWFRWTFPRVRFDQLLNICWKWLIPLSLINLIVTALVIKIAQ